MSHRVIQIHVRKGSGDLARKVSRISRVADHWPVGADGLTLSMLVRTQDVQAVTDRLQNLFTKSQIVRIVILPVEAVLPKPPQKAKANIPAEHNKKIFAGVSREELYNDTARGAELTNSYFWLVVFSTIVAGIGLIENNVAVIIGAMVIAPLLGPNLALALSTALGDLDLMMRSLKTMFVGFLVAFSISYILGAYWPYELDSPELLSRTRVGFDSGLLALVSGAAAVLSMATGLSSVLVGVMVAVALLPPGATMGIMLGAGKYDLALGAGLLLAVNIVCVNLAAKLVFLFRGVGPRTWYEKKKARRAMAFYLTFWILSLVFLAIMILSRSVTGLSI